MACSYNVHVFICNELYFSTLKITDLILDLVFNLSLISIHFQINSQGWGFFLTVVSKWGQMANGKVRLE